MIGGAQHGELIAALRGARWFGGKSRPIRAAQVVDSARWVEHAVVRLVDVEYEQGPSETYVLAEQFGEPEVVRGLVQRFSGGCVATEHGGQLLFEPTHLFGEVEPSSLEPIHLLRGEQSNSSVRMGDALMLKLFRRVQYGPNPEVEIARFLTEHTSFRGSSALVGSLDYEAPDGRAAALAVLQRFVPNRGDAWRTMLDRLALMLDGGDQAPGVEALARLGATTGALHVALASGDGDFAAEPIEAADLTAWGTAIHAEVEAAAEGLRRAGQPLDLAPLLQRISGLDALAGAEKIRDHGDYHLGQVLEQPDGEFVIIDFEGEPSRPLAVRRSKRSPLRDVAGMLRSFDYARHSALRARGEPSADDAQRVGAWHAAARQSFLDHYVQAVRAGAPTLLPLEVAAPLGAFELEKAAYEVLYELNNRPDWLPIPLAALSATL